MKRFVIVVAFFLIVLSSCDEQRLETPSEAPYLMAAHVKEESLVFIDTDRYEVLLKDESPVAITEMVSIGDGQVLVTSKEGESLMVIHLHEGTISPFVHLNEGLTSLLYDEEKGQAYVADTVNHAVHLIDVSQQERLASMEIGAHPVDFVLSKDELFVLSGDEHEVIVVDRHLQEGLRAFSVVERPAGLFHDGEQLWVGGHGPFGELNRHIYSYDPNSGELMDEIEVGLMPIAFYGDDTSPYFYVLCHGEHSIYQIDSRSNDVVNKLEVGQNPNQIIGNETYLYVSNLDSDTISIIDRETFEVITELAVSAGPYAMVLEE
ncbi:YncE family protein [Halalkalibacter sp. AB-rgal2]|uniref:YncE family protein n=1 Tax=Halalkalibacter sp. AB-rgal2 TaxID=3242695 RepID=UPI00359D1FFC